jgi:hypothetical protein
MEGPEPDNLDFLIGCIRDVLATIGAIAITGFVLGYFWGYFG